LILLEHDDRLQLVTAPDVGKLVEAFEAVSTDQQMT
jgi:hypothetical protein